MNFKNHHLSKICLIALLLATVFLTGCGILKSLIAQVRESESVAVSEETSNSEEETAEEIGEDTAESETVADVEECSYIIGERQFLMNMGAREDVLSYVPSVADYNVEPGLANIENKDRVHLQDHMVEQLVDNNFVVVDGQWSEFFDIYEMNRYTQFPNFITVDSMMHTYHLYYAMLQKNTERDYLIEDAKSMSADMLRNSISQYEELEGTEWEDAAAINVAYFAVASSLIGANVEMPDINRQVIDAEIALINGQEGISISPLNGEYEDYSQYKPRGYYEETEALKQYFKTMMWYGRRNFVQKDETLDRSALLMTLALTGNAAKNWEEIYSITSFFAGASDDSGIYEYLPIIHEVYGEEVTVSDLIGNADAFEQYHQLTSKLDPPVINSVVTMDTNGETDRGEEEKGFRFMGQRFSVDAAIFTQLCYSNVGENSNGERRCLPDSLDVPAALGSDTALEILEDNGNFSFKGYEENMAATREQIGSADDTFWSASLYGGWMNTLRPLLVEKGSGYPSFMQSEEWNKKNLEGFLSSYTELKHDSVLYSKQFIAEMGGGDERLDDRGYVEPEPEVYARLSALTKNTSTGLMKFGVISDTDIENLDKLSTLADRLKEISIKELTGEQITEDDYELIRTYGGSIEHFWEESIKDKIENEDYCYSSKEFPAALVVDVATDPNGAVLEQAVGGLSEIYVAVPVDGKLRIASGLVYNYYQFTQPLDQRLTDSEWRRMIGMELTDDYEFVETVEVDQPEWTQSYRAKRIYE